MQRVGREDKRMERGVIVLNIKVGFLEDSAFEIG
jgi:hypothetical protein